MTACMPCKKSLASVKTRADSMINNSSAYTWSSNNLLLIGILYFLNNR